MGLWEKESLEQLVLCRPIYGIEWTGFLDAFPWSCLEGWMVGSVLILEKCINVEKRKDRVRGTRKEILYTPKILSSDRLCQYKTALARMFTS